MFYVSPPLLVSIMVQPRTHFSIEMDKRIYNQHTDGSNKKSPSIIDF